MTQPDLFDAASVKVKFISAGAGSGKTYRLTEELERALTRDGVEPARVIGTTFTVKAAAELNDRVRARLIGSGRGRLAERLAEGLIGTVHSVCERLLKRFAFELGLSPSLNVVSLEDAERFFAQALDQSLDAAQVRAMNTAARCLGIDDWQEPVKKVVDAARSNDIDPVALAAMGPPNADALLAHFPKPSTADLDGALFGAVKAAADGINPGDSTSKTTRNYHGDAQAAMYLLRRGDLPWPRWISLAKGAAGIRDGGDAFAVAVRSVAEHFAAHPRFQRDIRSYIERCFTIAAATLQTFQGIKSEHGLIDFTDMEQLTLHALDRADVRARLADELDLLLVDEFQDTNPMQLALFMKMLPLARDAVFVGDVKQAIYAFRGSDPNLVFATLAGLSARGGSTETLPRSYRSRPSLVEFTNRMFTAAFARDDMRADQVALAPHRVEGTSAPPVIVWQIGEKGAQRWHRLACAIGALVQEGMPVVDPDTGATRAIRFGDIAVLAATNANVEAIAFALRRSGTPNKMSLTGLLSVPEVVFARACLRRLDDAGDTLASAEIMSLAADGPAEAWLADRLRKLQAGEEAHRWGERDQPIIAAIARLRDDTATSSPVEIVARVLNYVGIRQIVTAWGPDDVTASQRQRNLDAFFDLAVQYEQHCLAQHEPATLTGFLFWIEHPSSPELDLQPVVTGGDAVHVLTYHKAKGLEWPVVVAMDFEFIWRSRLWDVRIDSSTEGFDVDHPLLRRRIRYWPNVFGRHRKGIDVLDAIEASAEGVQCAKDSASEARRLAYVGLTRARDTLIVIDDGRAASADSWRSQFDDRIEWPLAHDLGLPDARSRPPFTPRWFEARTPSNHLPIAVVNPSMAAPTGATMGRIIELGRRITVRDTQFDLLGNALHRIIAAHCLNPDSAGESARAAAVLRGYGVDAAIETDDALLAAQRLHDALRTQWNPSQLRVEHPINHRLNNGQTVRGFIDLLVSSAAGVHVIDHKTSPRPRSEWVDEVAAYAGQLRAYRDALRAAGEVVAGVWIHFAITGALVEVVLTEDRA